MDGIVEPGLELGQKWDGPFPSRPEPLLIADVPDLPLDADELLVGREGLMGSARGLQQIGLRVAAAVLQERQGRVPGAGLGERADGERRPMTVILGVDPDFASQVLRRVGSWFRSGKVVSSV